MKGTIYIDGVSIGEGEIINVEIENDAMNEKYSTDFIQLEGEFEQTSKFKEQHGLTQHFKSVRINGKKVA